MPKQKQKKSKKEEIEELNSFDKSEEDSEVSGEEDSGDDQFESGSEEDEDAEEDEDEDKDESESESESDNSDEESEDSDDSQIYSKYSDVYSDSDEEKSDEEDADGDGDQDPEKKANFLENVIKYLETDNIMYKKKQKYNEAMKVLKEDKSNLEALILKYLDEIGDDCIEVKGQGKLTKATSERKSAVKNENIREAISEVVKKEKLVEKDEDTIELINMIMEIIDTKRVVTKKDYLKRTRERKKKGKKKKSSGKKR